MGIGRRRWLASERVAAEVLGRMGYTIVEAHKRLEVEGVEVGEVDFIAVGPDGERYAVEVKAGRLDVHGVRQAYVNALVAGAKPMVVCKGFADDAAKALAEKLGVRVIELNDVFLVDPEELEATVEAAAARVAADLLSLLFDPAHAPKPSEMEALKALAEEPTPVDAARRLGVKLSELKPLIERLRRVSLARQGPEGLRLAARLLLLRSFVESRLSSLEAAVERLEKIAEKL